jgi:hypothetical protein
MPQHQSTYNRQGPNGGVNQQPASGGRWDAILADRQNSSHNNSGNNSNPRTGGSFSGNYNNRNNRDNNGGYGGRRDHEPHKPFHSHVGGQSGDAPGTDWSTPLPANANLER